MSPAAHIGHNASAVLVRDGEIVAATEEERFTRIKNHNVFPSSPWLKVAF